MLVCRQFVRIVHSNSFDVVYAVLLCKQTHEKSFVIHMVAILLLSLECDRFVSIASVLLPDVYTHSFSRSLRYERNRIHIHTLPFTLSVAVSFPFQSALNPFCSILFCSFIGTLCEWWFLFLFITFSTTLLLVSRFPFVSWIVVCLFFFPFSVCIWLKKLFDSFARTQRTCSRNSEM